MSLAPIPRSPTAPAAPQERRRLQDWREIPSLDLDELLAQSARVASAESQCEIAEIYLFSESEQSLRLAASHPAPRSTEPIPIDPFFIPGRVVFEGVPVWVEDLRTLQTAEYPRARAVGLAAMLGVPIVVGNRCLGALVLGHRQGHRFEPSEVEQALGLAAQLAVSVEKAHLYHEATQRIAELSLLHEVGQAITEREDLEEILHRAADHLSTLLDTSGCFVWLLDAASQRLRGVAASAELNDEIKSLQLPDRSLAMEALRQRRAIGVDDAASDPRVDPTIARRFGGKSLLAIPMFHRGRAIGALTFDERRGPRHFTQAEIDRASLVASQLAAAVENARLYEDLKSSYGELALAQAKLVQRERLAALGELAAVVAHEVRNPLGAMFNALSGLRRMLGESGEVGVLLSILGEESDRINRIIGDLLDFARPPDLAVGRGSLTSAVQEAMSAALSVPGIEVQCRIEPGLDQARMDQRQIRQALLNLFHNAVQAMPTGGHVRIWVHRVERRGIPAVAIDVADSGPGIAPGLIERIFEPFYTTKASGTGLGLAVVRRIAEGHGGNVEVRNGDIRGAVFSLLLPLDAGGEA
jgi:two-component system sensor histidine kinase HydH